MEPRQHLSKRELLALLNWELAAYEQCEGARFSAIRTMRERDDTDCNWFDARVQSDHALGVDEHFIVQQVIAETRRKFDVRTR